MLPGRRQLPTVLQGSFVLGGQPCFATELSRVIRRWIRRARKSTAPFSREAIANRARLVRSRLAVALGLRRDDPVGAVGVARVEARSLACLVRSHGLSRSSDRPHCLVRLVGGPPFAGHEVPSLCFRSPTPARTERTCLGGSCRRHQGSARVYRTCLGHAWRPRAFRHSGPRFLYSADCLAGTCSHHGIGFGLGSRAVERHVVMLSTFGAR